MKNGGVWEVDLTAGQSTYKFYSPNTRYLNGIAYGHNNLYALMTGGSLYEVDLAALKRRQSS